MRIFKLLWVDASKQHSTSASLEESELKEVRYLLRSLKERLLKSITSRPSEGSLANSINPRRLQLVNIKRVKLEKSEKNS